MPRLDVLALQIRPALMTASGALRHTCASDVLDRCNNVRTVQAVLGHASLATIEVYLRRANLDQMREALEGRSYSP